MNAAPAFLDDDEIEQLGELLDEFAVPRQGFNMEALDGFLSALAVSPDIIAPEQWQSLVWGGPTPQWQNDAQGLLAQRLLLGHWNACQARVRNAQDELPEHLSPLLWLPENPDEPQPDALDVGNDWAHGFFSAVELCPEAWQSWLDGNGWIDEIFVLLERLATGEVEPDPDSPDADAAVQSLTFNERMEVVASLPSMLADLHQHRIEALTPRQPVRRVDTPDRNAPCPCGSGRKYKTCHGTEN